MRLTKGRLIIGLLLFAVSLYAIITILVLQPKIDRYHAQAAALEDQIAALEEQNGILRSDIAALGTDASIAQIARQRLMMIAEGETVYIDSNR